VRRPNLVWHSLQELVSTCARRFDDRLVVFDAPQMRLRYAYNCMGVQRSYVGADGQIPEGTHPVRMEFAYDGGGLGKGGTVTL
jgi:hypothetical protein